MKYIDKKIGTQEILIHENLIEISNCYVQFICQLKRNFLPIYRNKLMLIIEYLSGLGINYILLFCIPNLIELLNSNCLNLLKILGSNHIYFYGDNSAEEVLKDSYAYSYLYDQILSEKIKLKILSKKPNSVEHLIDLSYKESLANIAMGCISINQIGDNWHTYVTGLNLGNLYADTMLVVSAFLKKQFGINALILNKIKMKEEFKVSQDIEVNTYFILLFLFIGGFFGYILFLGGLINEKIKERKTNIKHLLYLSGSNPWSYWIAFFIIDYLKLLLFSLLLLIPILIIIRKYEVFYFLLNFLIVNASSLIFIYLVSFFGSNPKSGIKFLILLLIVFWIVLYLIIMLLYLFYKDNDDSIFSNFNEKEYIFKCCFTVFDLIPITSMALSFFRMFMAFIKFQKDEIQSIDKYLLKSYFAQGINFVFYFLLLILLEVGYLRNFFNWFKLKFCLSEKYYVFSENTLSDEFLLDEINTIILNDPLIQDGNKDLIINDSNENSINRISLSEASQSYDIRKSNFDVNKEKYMLDKRNDFTTRIEGLYKTFWLCCRKNVRAINNLNLGLEANEKFGLLGLNGSGKTTTFKAITNEILYDYGKISLFGFDTRKEFKHIRSKIGYCPQENPLFDFMKVREILEFYSKLKTCFLSIEEICKKFGLTKYLDTYCVNLSGGNKRKLTFVIAIMNRPTLLLLDEPSTGVDPDSRRFMWKNINELSNSGHRYNMILTTHSMEEAEILCDRVGWLKKGSFACIGNPEKLKIQYSLGYKLHIKFDDQLITI